MENTVHKRISSKLPGKKLHQERLVKYWKWQSNAKAQSMSKFTRFGKLEVAENIIPLSLFRKINDLYLSSLDAKKVLSKYKNDLSLMPDPNTSSITPLTVSNANPMLFYKREDLTSIKAYKIRGALYQMSKIVEENSSVDLKFVAASTGNHALGVLRAAEILKVSDVTICISECVTKFKQEKLQKKVEQLKANGVNAKLLIKGENFDQTNQIAKNLVVSEHNCFYIDPYNTHNAVAGQGTIGLELLDQLEEVLSASQHLKELTVIAPIGGGGLISGTSCALKTGINNFHRLKGLKVNIVGVSLDSLDSLYGDAIKVESTGENNTEYLSHFIDNKFLINDNDMKKGIDFVNADIEANVEGASAGTLKPILNGSIIPSESHAVVCVLSGGNTNY